MVRLPVPNPAEREDPGGNASGRLAFPIRGFRQFQQGRAGQTRRPVRALWQVPERPLAPQADRNRAGALSRLADDVMVRQAT